VAAACNYKAKLYHIIFTKLETFSITKIKKKIRNEKKYTNEMVQKAMPKSNCKKVGNKKRQATRGHSGTHRDRDTHTYMGIWGAWQVRALPAQHKCLINFFK